MTGPSDRNGNYHGEDGRFVSLKEYIETIIKDHDRLYSERAAQQARELALAREELERRLEGLNELRKQVVQDRAMFFTKEAHEFYAARVQEQVDSFKDFRSRVFGVAAAFVALTAVIVYLIERAVGG